MKVSDLRVGMRSVNVEGRITDISETRRVTTRRGEESRVATATLVDNTGSVKLTLWNEAIDTVKVGNVVSIENGYVTSFRGETQLNVGRFGRLTVLR